MTDNVLRLRRVCLQKLAALQRRTNKLLTQKEREISAITAARLHDQPLQIAMHLQELPPFDLAESERDTVNKYLDILNDIMDANRFWDYCERMGE